MTNAKDNDYYSKTEIGDWRFDHFANPWKALIYLCETKRPTDLQEPSKSFNGPVGSLDEATMENCARMIGFLEAKGLVKVLRDVQYRHDIGVTPKGVKLYEQMTKYVQDQLEK